MIITQIIMIILISLSYDFNLHKNMNITQSMPPGARVLGTANTIWYDINIYSYTCAKTFFNNKN